MGITQYRLAKEIGVSQRRIGEIIAGKRTVTVDTGLRLSRFFGTSDAFWIGLQIDCDTAQAKDTLSEVLSRIHRFDPARVYRLLLKKQFFDVISLFLKTLPEFGIGFLPIIPPTGN
jgi:addiction module HigA family antidote